METRKPTARERYEADPYGTGQPEDLVALVGQSTDYASPHAADQPALYLRETEDGALVIGDAQTEVPIEDDADIESVVAEWRAATTYH